MATRPIDDHPPRILLVEDEPTVRTIAEALLDSFGYKVTAVVNGAEALAALAKQQVDLILSDVRMPVVDGFELLQKVRANPAWYQIPFIVVSAKAESADLRMGMSLGADDYVTKPYLPAEMEKAIAVRLKRSRSLSQAMEHQQRFLTRTLPHELRTPLTGVIGCADLMADLAADGQTLSADELADYARIIQQSGERMLRIVENFLFWARLESAQATRRGLGDTPQVEELITVAGCANVAETVATQFHRRHDLAASCPEDMVVKVITRGFEFVARHLIENAFKYSIPGDIVRVATKLEGNSVRFSVTDEGRGMTPEQITQAGLFRQFSREKFEQQGMGMGLMLAMDFARLSGGSLALQPGIQDKGLVVTLNLPAVAQGSE